ncbi:MAG: prepilin peptidase [Alphaproteobacteria bacterium]|nr:prepilin peptidase [Alphaproteobacteria bacterium]
MIFIPAMNYAATALLGLLFGSFAGLVAYRLPKGEAVMAGRSRCTQCGHALGAADLVPVLSWLRSRGRCRHCGGTVAWRYPLIEIATALLFVLALMAAGPGLKVIMLGLLAVGLVIITAIDLEYQIIPDQISLALAGLGLGYQALADTTFAGWLSAGAGAAAGISIAWLLRALFQRIKGREALGLGDVKFFAVAGLWTGVHGLADFMMFSGLAGILFAAGWQWRGGDAVFPFGPALAAGLYAVVLLKAGGAPQPLSLLMIR